MSKMTLPFKICLFAVKLFENHGIKVDCAELLSLSIILSLYYLIGKDGISNLS